MTMIQLIGILISLLAIYITYLHYKRSHFNSLEFFIWLVIWLAFMVVAIWPKIMSPLVGYLHLNRSMDLIMIVAFVVLFSLCFHNYIIIHSLEKKIEKMIREEALKDLSSL